MFNTEDTTIIKIINNQFSIERDMKDGICS